ncbi:MAG: RNase A-like domain-containing protein [Pseudomonadota bacterium]
MDYTTKLLWLRYTHSWLRVKIALLDLELHLYNPNQPRVPAGRPDGGQWTDGDGDVIPAADNERPGGDRYLNPHIMANHVGKSNAELVERLRRSQFRLFGYNSGLDRNGSFASIEDARDLISRTIEMNADEVARVAGGQLPDAFLTHRFGYVTGREAYAEPSDSEIIRIRKTYEVGVYILHNSQAALGYQIHTAYPRNFNARIGR